MSTPNAYIIDAVRTPVGRRGGGLSQVHPADIGAHSIKSLIERTGVDPNAVDDVIFGNVDSVGPAGVWYRYSTQEAFGSRQVSFAASQAFPVSICFPPHADSRQSWFAHCSSEEQIAVAGFRQYVPAGSPLVYATQVASVSRQVSFTGSHAVPDAINFPPQTFARQS